MTQLSPQEIHEEILTYLDQTRDGVLSAVQNLPPPQWTFQPAPGRWSVAEVLEHLVIIENAVQARIATLGQGAPADPDRNIPEIDEMVLTKVLDRSVKVQGPPQADPIGRWTPSETLEHFVSARARTQELFRSIPGLRQRVLNHPVLGLLDGHQWILAAAAHSQRHTRQIEEVVAAAADQPK